MPLDMFARGMLYRAATTAEACRTLTGPSVQALVWHCSNEPNQSYLLPVKDKVPAFLPPRLSCGVKSRDLAMTPLHSTHLITAVHMDLRRVYLAGVAILRCNMRPSNAVAKEMCHVRESHAYQSAGLAGAPGHRSGATGFGHAGAGRSADRPLADRSNRSGRFGLSCTQRP